MLSFDSNKSPDRYNDIIDLPHHVSRNHPRMSELNRAAQFSPFAALTGYEDQVKETARLTDQRVQLSDDILIELDQKLNRLKESHGDELFPKIEVFIRDSFKDGGRYELIQKKIRRIDDTERIIVFDDASSISFDDVTDISF